MMIQAPCLLVASADLRDKNFNETVILVIEHDDQGTLGFIINRLSPYGLDTMLENEGLEIPDHIPTWYGGPIGLEAGVILHHDAPKSMDKVVSKGIYLSSSEDILRQMIDYWQKNASAQLAEMPPEQKASAESPWTIYPYRFLVGYAGWAPDQLEEEIQAGYWDVIPFDSELVYHTPWQKIWSQARKSTKIHMGQQTLPHSNLLN